MSAMTEEWAAKLKAQNIEWTDDGDYIKFYDPEERPGYVQIRRHLKSQPDEYYKSERIGTMSYAEFSKLFPNNAFYQSLKV